MAQKNFLGFSTKPAKIAFFFQDGAKIVAPKKEAPKPRPKPKRAKPEPTQAPAAKPKRPVGQEPWSQEMIDHAQNWMSGLLKTVNLGDKKFTTTTSRYHLKFAFDGPVLETEDKNRLLFRNCSLLLLQALRNEYKRPLKGFKVILTTGS